MSRMALCGALMTVFALAGEMENARDRQDRAGLEKLIASAARKEAYEQTALGYSYLAEVALELRDRKGAQQAAEAGIRAAEQSLARNPKSAESHRLLGTLCGQVIPANVLAGLRYGKRSQEAIARALDLDPKSARAHLARGVGHYYLPEALGGGMEKALRDFRRAIELDPVPDEAYLWLGLALRKLNRMADARAALEKSLALNPRRVWTRQQLDKTPR
ncbi:MAG: tetratricopeptide repeat protein [Bryobacteraceae bacterium]